MTHCTLEITISEQHQLQCIVIDKKETKHIIKLNNQNDNYLPIRIAFDMNEIIIGKETPNSIDFMKEWIDHPEIFKEYRIRYQNKEYNVISELLFALIINEFKKKIEKDFIIDEIKFTLPTENKEFVNRFKISLDSIDLKGIEFDDSEYNYQNQGDLLENLIEKIDEYNKFKSIIQNRTTLPIDNTKPFTEREYNQLITQFGFQERSRLKLSQLDNYCIFLSSKWFESIEDHINLTKVCKRLKLNMEKFHFNPIPLTETTREYFPFLQTLYQYYQNDNLFLDDERIIAREYPLLMKYVEYKEMRQLEEWTNKKCTEIVFDSDKDNWSENTSVFDSKVINKSNLIILIEDKEGQKFGGYVNEKITGVNTWINDQNAFLFSLNSNGRLNGMMKFNVSNPSRAFMLYPKTSENNILFRFGYKNGFSDIRLNLKDSDRKSVV